MFKNEQKKDVGLVVLRRLSSGENKQVSRGTNAIIVAFYSRLQIQESRLEMNLCGLRNGLLKD
jgi:hypothetical protein